MKNTTENEHQMKYHVSQLYIIKHKQSNKTDILRER